MNTHYARSRAEYESDVDMSLAGSFPASDPPHWTSGVSAGFNFDGLVVPLPVPAQVDLVIGGSRRFGDSRLSSVAEAIGLVALVPLGILIAGVPIVAVGWAVVEAIAGLAGSR
ncbi:MAG TPA: hypothetical protein VFZ38_10520 [Vicinamibacterales bacterium]|jgi:hypothetical protein